MSGVVSRNSVVFVVEPALLTAANGSRFQA